MKFRVQPEVFEVLPNVCFGIVVAKGINNKGKSEFVGETLTTAIEDVRGRFPGIDSRDIPEIEAYRNAFQTLGYNPNKFMCSIEALVRRVLKGGKLPNINNVVDLGNAISLKHLLPIGAHDLAAAVDDIEVRYSSDSDLFTPFGSEESERMTSGELVYARGNSVKTRRWIWRQGVPGMIGEDTTEVFFPIDGFADINSSAVLVARNELDSILRDNCGAKTSVGWVDAKNQEFVIS